MKKQLVMLFCAAVCFFAACRKDDVSKIVIHGDWKISSYKMNGIDRTADYSDYTFSFDRNNQLKVSSNDGTVEGTWYKSASDYQQKLLLDFNAGTKLDSLVNDWYVMERQNKEVRLNSEMSDPQSQLIFTKK